jgi:hypothetical protein
MSDSCGIHGIQQWCIQGFCGRPEVRTPLGRLLRLKLEDNIKMNVQKLGWGGTDWTDLAQGGCKYGNDISGSIKYGEFYD